ncbi:hypothetical protein [Actinacidiphila yeochonensis]|uniref:hypothetical protein n=1 Tax=Actinacidiphila yeochonensis TaxID=89050 RepID=UPI000691A764|nr:hypothetical protein [Actinacidiphila yeochonensis]
MDAVWLSAASGVPESELQQVLAGEPPTAPHLGALARALGFHAADLHVMAGVPVPDALAPVDPAAGPATARLLRITMALPPDQRDHVHRSVERLPQEPPDGTVERPGAYDQEHAGFGAMLVNLLCGNRNLHPMSAAVHTLGLLSGGHVVLSPSTVNAVGRGRAELTPSRVAGFAAALGIPAGDLAAVAGVGLPEPSWPDDPLAAEAAGLLWNCRRLTGSQAERLRVEAEAMLVAVPDDAADEDWNRVHHIAGRWWGAPKR